MKTEEIEQIENFQSFSFGKTAGELWFLDIIINEELKRKEIIGLFPERKKSSFNFFSTKFIVDNDIKRVLVKDNKTLIAIIGKIEKKKD